MGVTPQYVGMYGRPWLINLNTDSGPDNLIGVTAANITIVVRNLSTSVPTDATSTGGITIVAATPTPSNPSPQILWQPTATDYAISGSFQLELAVTFPTGPVPYDPIPFTILAR